MGGGCADGSEPTGLTLASDGNFYGTTFNGGTDGWGTVFKITPDGTLTTLHNFDYSVDGGNPEAGLVQAASGNLYGTTSNGGPNDLYYGTVFKITPAGALTTLYSFCSQSGCSDGSNPTAGLVQGLDGNLYGTTQYGGGDSGGTVFKISLAGTLTTLYTFCPQTGCTDGQYPSAALVQATDGNLYGTTQNGGANNGGVIFKITPSGTLTQLYSFCSQSGCTDGANPHAGLAQETNGNLYGAAEFGGTSGACTGGCGTIFSLSVSLRPFVETKPAAAKVGKPINILGSSLKGATSVTFNGTAATFTVESSSLITTTVPNGATTGRVRVVTPHGTFSSNVPFRVVQ